MKIHQIFFKNSLRNFCYLLSFDNCVTYCIDPFSSAEIMNNLNNRPITAIINTHDHCDHYSGNEDLVSIHKCAVMAHPAASVPFKSRNLTDQEIIYDGMSNGNRWVLRSIHTPGHTLSHLCVLLEKNGCAYALFTGDCFFNAGVGNCHNGGDPEILYQTISTIFEKLPDELFIYPGHEYLKRNLEFTTNYEPKNCIAKNFLDKIATINLDKHFFVNTMKIERDINTFLRLDSKDLLEKLNLVNSNKKKTFLTLRELRNHW